MGRLCRQRSSAHPLGSFAVALGLSLLSGCGSFLPSMGPSRGGVVHVRDSRGVAGIQVVEVSDEVARRLMASKRLDMFNHVFPEAAPSKYQIGSGDVLEVMLMEAAPGALFTGLSLSGTSMNHIVTLPEQIVSYEGEINIPFAGQVIVAGKTPSQVERDIVRKLRGKANQPQVIVRVTRNNSSSAIVVGDVNVSMRLPLTPKGERILDAIAAAGGVRQSVNKTTIQLARGTKVHSLPLETIIRDPRQNIALQSGDVITSLFQSLTFTVLGATGRNEEIGFEAQGISLAQALARAGGLNDTRADARGVFIFRFENPEALVSYDSSLTRTPEGKVPVVYRVDLKNPASFFVAQNFPVQNGDVLYVSNAPGAQLQKFLNMMQSTLFSAQGVLNTQKGVDRIINGD